MVVFDEATAAAGKEAAEVGVGWVDDVDDALVRPDGAMCRPAESWITPTRSERLVLHRMVCVCESRHTDNSSGSLSFDMVVATVAKWPSADVSSSLNDSYC